MLANVPVLAIGPNNGDLAKIMHQTQVGLISDFEDEINIEKNILSLFNNQTVNRNETEIVKYSRKNLTQQLAHILNTL